MVEGHEPFQPKTKPFTTEIGGNRWMDVRGSSIHTNSVVREYINFGNDGRCRVPVERLQEAR
jgi:hypothetical protein